MFRRNTSHTPAVDQPTETPGEGKKGRPTPTRKEAEAAARAKAQLPKDKRAMARRQRELRVQSSRKMRAGLKAGDEKSLPARDQGPVRRFVRDFVDSRLVFAELFAPVLILIMVLIYGAFGPTGVGIGNGLMTTTIFLVIVDLTWLRFRLRRAVRERFPDESLKGLTVYGLMRALNMRFMRLPKPRVKIGQELPEHYH